MTSKPVVYETTHRIAFSELDPFQHVSTGNYARYFTDHRMEGLAKYAGWTRHARHAGLHDVDPADGDRLHPAGERRPGDHDHLVRARVPWPRAMIE